MRTPIRYKLVPTGTQEFAQLQQFAKTFDHEIIAHPHINVYAHYKGDKLFGYSDHVFSPVVYPAFHPEFTTPRDVVQVMNDWCTHTQFTGQIPYIGVPTQDQGGKFTEQVMNKLSLQKTNREIYIY